jgi:hypothetical protein
MHTGTANHPLPDKTFGTLKSITAGVTKPWISSASPVETLKGLGHEIESNIGAKINSSSNK